jgi:hypothetical protein
VFLFRIIYYNNITLRDLLIKRIKRVIVGWDLGGAGTGASGVLAGLNSPW